MSIIQNITSIFFPSSVNQDALQLNVQPNGRKTCQMEISTALTSFDAGIFGGAEYFHYAHPNVCVVDSLEKSKDTLNYIDD